jgi:hypothetical protein
MRTMPGARNRQQVFVEFRAAPGVAEFLRRSFADATVGPGARLKVAVEAPARRTSCP